MDANKKTRKSRSSRSIKTIRGKALSARTAKSVRVGSTAAKRPTPSESVSLDCSRIEWKY